MRISSHSVFLVSVLLALCGSVAGESRGTIQRRRTAISGRETHAPTPVIDSDVGKGVGKGMKVDKSYKSLPGKGMKSEKSKKSTKSEKKMEGKGIDMSFSMEMEFPGKGLKKAKDTKIFKSFKSGKSEKKIKKEKENGKGITPSTPSPTSADSISSKSSVFAITYSPTKKIPTSEDLQELTMLTQKYLEDFMMDFFDKTALTDLDNFLTIMVRDVFVAGEPVLAEFQSNGLFNPDSIFIPVTRELDNLIQDAISQDDYLEMLESLPRSNPFRGTTTIAFTETDTNAADGEGASSNSSESSSFVRAGVAAAAAGVVVLAAGLAVLKSRRPLPDEDSDEIRSFTPSKPSDTSITGDSYNMSVDETSSRFPHWRNAKSYTDGSEAGEFEDEPLDS